MKWQVWPTKEARKDGKTPGIELTGQEISAAPAPGTVWTVTEGGVTHLVRKHRAGNYEIDPDCYSSRKDGTT